MDQSVINYHSLFIMVQAHIFAHGRVQGVNFRYYVYKRATGLGLKGYVCNLRDGRVEIVVQGLQEDVQKLLNYVKSNPGLSYVVKLDIDWEEKLSNSLSCFRIEF